MTKTSTTAAVIGGGAFLLLLVWFMTGMVSRWEVEEAQEAARQVAADVALGAIEPKLAAVESAAASAQSAAEAAQGAVERAASEISRQMAIEAVQALAREQERKEAEEAAAATLADLIANVGTMTYDQARWHPLHFSPEIEKATDEQCLVCHAELLEREVAEASPAGVQATDALAWYQTLDTYSGDQQTFHQRHTTSEYASEVMNLSCNFCHKGNDPREEAAQMPLEQNRTQLASTGPAGDLPAFALRKMVNPTDTCLRCHGDFPWEIMEGLTGPWHEIRGDFEFEPGENGCLTCHGELFRTVRHQVSYLQADRIEELAQESSDVCYGCHGGRAWYQISYPYPRHPWPDMPEEIPEWAADRSTESDPRYRLDTAGE